MIAAKEPTLDSSNGLTSGSVRLALSAPKVADVLNRATDIAAGPAWDAGAGGSSPYDGSPALGVLSFAGAT